MKIYHYDYLIKSKQVNSFRVGKGLGSYALIEYHSLPERFRLRFEAKYGNPEKIMKQEDMPLAVDSEAQKYYHEYLLPNGEHLPAECAGAECSSGNAGNTKSDATCVQQQYAGHLV